MFSMIPIFTYAALYHLFLLFSIRIRIRAITSTVCTFEVMVVGVLHIFYILTCLKLTDEVAKLGVSTIAPKVSLGPELHNLQNNS